MNRKKIEGKAEKGFANIDPAFYMYVRREWEKLSGGVPPSTQIMAIAFKSYYRGRAEILDKLSKGIQ